MKDGNKTIQEWVMGMYNLLQDDEDYQYEKYREDQQEQEQLAYEEMLSDGYR